MRNSDMFVCFTHFEGRNQVGSKQNGGILTGDFDLQSFCFSCCIAGQTHKIQYDSMTLSGQRGRIIQVIFEWPGLCLGNYDFYVFASI